MRRTGPVALSSPVGRSGTTCYSLRRGPDVLAYSTDTIPMHRARVRGFWEDLQNQRGFLDQLAHSLNIREYSDWYGVSRREVKQRGGARLFSQYSSLGDALQTIYPDHPWDRNQFIQLGRAPPGHWNSNGNLHTALTHAEQQLGIKQPEDWYGITLSELQEVGFPLHVNRMKLLQLLEERYPNHSFEKAYLLRGKYAQQNRLEKAVKALFPAEEILINVRKEVGIVNPDTGDYLELDIFIPSLRLAFEYQERHHYTSSEYAFQPLSSFQERDAIKQKMAKEKGITLIVVPCWWNNKAQSLIASIQKMRPDLLVGVDTGLEDPIPEHMPPNFLAQQSPHIEGIGQPTTACFLTRMNTDPKDWWIFEKYDGVRAFWNPEKKAFYSRLGNRFDVFPHDVLASMPDDVFLDGELWFGRDTFHEASRIANRADVSEIDWTKFKYMVFDIPTHRGTYEARYNELQARLSNSNQSSSFLEVAPMQVCKDSAHLDRVFQDIIDTGGEGIILRDPSSIYQPGRSSGYLKHKNFRDSEAMLVRPLGAYQWECKLPNGILFTAAAGTTEFVKRWNPQSGDIVTFKHRGFLLSTKKPKLATLHRLRPDLTWDTIVQNWKEQQPTRIGSPSIRKKKHKPKGFWNNNTNRRNFFFGVAEKMGFDPLQPDSWKSITNTQILEKKGAGVLAIYGGSIKRALIDTFPELTFPFQARKNNTSKRKGAEG